MFKRLKKTFSLLLPVILLVVTSVHAQIRIASPYSRFGLGDITPNSNAWNASMGEIGIAIRSPYHVNFSNPASYTAFDSTSFVFEGGFLSNFTTLTSSTQSDSRTYASLAYLLFGVPVTKWWKSTIGLVPFSDVGYNVSSIDVVDGIGTVDRLYTGAGGINRFFWGNGFRIFKGFSIGINASYLFGSFQRESVVIFPDSIYFLEFKVANNTAVNNLYFDYGIQYTKALKKGLRVTAGGVFSANTKVSTRTDIVSETFFLGADGTEHPRDTITEQGDVHGSLLLPMMVGAGISFEKTDKWVAGADFRWQNWKKLNSADQKDSLVNSYQVSIGAEFLPDLNSYTNYLKRIRYRIGLLYNRSYVELKDNKLNQYAATIGFGLPLKGMKTALNIGLQAGVRGTTASGLIKESYFKLIVGFSIYEKWFIKRKYY
jgi:hypothetical protein